MKTVHEMIQIMQAYERGEWIEFQQYGRKWLEDKTWHDVQYPAWDWLHADYRIKPKPEFRPFKNAEEFLEAQKEHGIVTSTGELLFINSDNIVYIDGTEGLESGKCGFEYLFENFKFADGTPCGKEVEL